MVTTSAISSGSACIFLASRTLYGLSSDGHAPRIFLQCNRWGTPFWAVALSLLPSPLVYLTISNNSSIVFGWFLNITTVAGLIGWIVIQVTYLKFFYALKKQGISREGGQPKIHISHLNSNHISRTSIQEPFSTIHSLDYSLDGIPGCILLWLRCLLPWELQCVKLLDLLPQHCNILWYVHCHS